MGAGAGIEAVMSVNATSPARLGYPDKSGSVPARFSAASVTSPLVAGPGVQ
jgi:hypothetical protein